MWYVITAVLSIGAGIVIDQIWGDKAANSFIALLRREFDLLYSKVDALHKKLDQLLDKLERLLNKL